MNLIASMRDWLSDCQWTDVDADELALMPDWQIIAGVQRHYAGGLVAFVREAIAFRRLMLS